MPKRTKSSRRWLDEHFDDEFVKRAQAENWRSRAVFKLAELDERGRLIAPGDTIVDLGAAPGGWSQYAAGKVGPGGLVVATDLLEMEPLPGVAFVQGDFREMATLDGLKACLADRPVDLVMSDMAPNISGMNAVDQPRAMHLAELALDMSTGLLRPGGGLVVKLFQGEGFDDFVRDLRARFGSVSVRKPKASRSRSREVYAVARNHQP